MPYGIPVVVRNAAYPMTIVQLDNPILTQFSFCSLQDATHIHTHNAIDEIWLRHIDGDGGDGDLCGIAAGCKSSPVFIG